MAVFHSNIKAWQITMKIGGRVRYFNFSPKEQPYNYGYLYVNKPEEVAALKKHPQYGKRFWIDREEKPQVEEVVTPKLKEYPEIRKTQDAKDILKNEYKYNVENIRSKAQALEAAAELGISFPNL